MFDQRNLRSCALYWAIGYKIVLLRQFEGELRNIWGERQYSKSWVKFLSGFFFLVTPIWIELCYRILFLISWKDSLDLLKLAQTFRNSKSGLCNKGKDCFPDGNYWVALHSLSNFFLVLRSESGLQKYISFLEQICCKTQTNCLLTKFFNFGTKSRISSTLSKTPFILNFSLKWNELQEYICQKRFSALTLHYKEWKINVNAKWM